LIDATSNVGVDCAKSAVVYQMPNATQSNIVL
jgi:hypothetical protein